MTAITMLRLFLVLLAINSVGLLLLFVLEHVSTPCVRHGHQWSLVIAPLRIFLICDLCGHESPGWNLFTTLDGCERRARI